MRARAESETTMHRQVAQSSIELFAVRATRPSSHLERRDVPDGFVRAANVELFLARKRVGGQR